MDPKPDDVLETPKRSPDLLLCKGCLRSCQGIREFLLHKCACVQYPYSCDLCDKSINSMIELEVHYQCWHNVITSSGNNRKVRFNKPKTSVLRSTSVPADKDQTSVISAVTQLPSILNGASCEDEAEPKNSLSNDKSGLEVNQDIVGALHGVASALQPITSAGYSTTDATPETQRIVGVLQNVATALQPLLRANPDAKLQTADKAMLDKMEKESVEQLLDLHNSLEKALKMMISSERETSKRDVPFVCTSLTLIVNGTIELTAKPKQKETVNRTKTQHQINSDIVHSLIGKSQLVPKIAIREYKQSVPVKATLCNQVFNDNQLPPRMVMVRCPTTQAVPMMKVPMHQISRTSAPQSAIPIRSMSPIILTPSVIANSGKAMKSLPKVVFVPGLQSPRTSIQPICHESVTLTPQTATSTPTLLQQTVQFAQASMLPRSRTQNLMKENTEEKINNLTTQLPTPIMKNTQCTTTQQLQPNSVQASTKPTVPIATTISMDVDDLLVRKRPLSNSDTESTCPAKQQRVESVALHTSGADTTTNTTDISGHASQIHTILQNRFLGPAGVMYTMEPVAKKSVGTPAGNKGLAVDSTVSTGNDAVSVEVDMTNAVQEQNVSVVLRTNAYMKDSNGQATENKPTDSRSQATENKPTDSRSQAMDNKPTDSNGHAVDNKPIDSSGVMSGDCEGCRESVPFVFEHFSKIKNVHRVTFSDLKTAPYKCPDCVYETSIDVMLLSHHYAQFHGGYKCPQCETVSCDAANLKLHLDSKHLVI